jgi:hypothetical protein
MQWYNFDEQTFLLKRKVNISFNQKKRVTYAFFNDPRRTTRY